MSSSSFYVGLLQKSGQKLFPGLNNTHGAVSPLYGLQKKTISFLFLFFVANACGGLMLIFREKKSFYLLKLRLSVSSALHPVRSYYTFDEVVANSSGVRQISFLGL